LLARLASCVAHRRTDPNGAGSSTPGSAKRKRPEVVELSDSEDGDMMEVLGAALKK